MLHNSVPTPNSSYQQAFMLGTLQFSISLSPGCVFVLIPLDYILHCITMNHAIYYMFKLLKDIATNIIDCM
jgi:hypothetical protein